MAYAAVSSPCSLPGDVWLLIRAHGAASCLQSRWRRYSRFGHARRRAWPQVRDHLRECGAWREAWQYAGVRREWRGEPESWLHVEDPSILLCEMRRGLWGARLRPFARDPQ